MNNETRDERLRRMLREADPAEGEPGLNTDEIRAMRRAALTAIPERKRRFVFSPALAGAAVAVLVAIAVLTIWPREQPAPPAPQATTKVAVKATPPTRSGLNSGTAEGVPSGITESTAGRRARRPAATNLRPTVSVAAGLRARRPAHHTHAEEPERLAQQNETEPQTRQIQFSTAGGTRVIWILTSDKAR